MGIIFECDQCKKQVRPEGWDPSQGGWKMPEDWGSRDADGTVLCSEACFVLFTNKDVLRKPEPKEVVH